MEATAEITAAVMNVPALRFPEFEGEWKEVNFDKIAEKSKAKYNPEKETIVYPCIELESLSQDTGILLETFNSKEQLSIKNKFKQGEVLYGKLRPYLRKYLIAPFDGVCSSEIWVFNGKKVSNEFLYRLIQGDKFNYFANVSSGSKMPRADWDYLSSSPVSYPTIAEQHKIASFLTIVDDKIQQLSNKKELLEKYKKGVMQQIFSQQIRFKDDNGNEFPEWEQKRLGDISKISKGKGVSKSDITDEGELECIRYGELYTHYGEVIQDVISRTNVNAKELILSEFNDVIIPASGETQLDIAKASCVLKDGVALGGDLNIIKTKTNGIFLSYYLNNKCKKDIAKIAQGVSVVHLYASQLQSLKLYLPIVAEQDKIANFLISIDNKINYTSKQLEQAQQFKKGLLQQLFV